MQFRLILVLPYHNAQFVTPDSPHYLHSPESLTADNLIHPWNCWGDSVYRELCGRFWGEESLGSSGRVTRLERNAMEAEIEIKAAAPAPWGQHLLHLSLLQRWFPRLS